MIGLSRCRRMREHIMRTSRSLVRPGCESMAARAWSSTATEKPCGAALRGVVRPESGQKNKIRDRSDCRCPVPESQLITRRR
jgi:hypothetical protein